MPNGRPVGDNSFFLPARSNSCTFVNRDPSGSRAFRHRSASIVCFLVLKSDYICLVSGFVVGLRM